MIEVLVLKYGFEVLPLEIKEVNIFYSFYSLSGFKKVLKKVKKTVDKQLRL